MSQLSLLPIQLVDEQPADRSESRDLLWIGLDEQDRRYALKTADPPTPHLPLIEWLCYHLCGLAGIITPEFAIVIRLDGSRVFGSRWAEGAQQFSPAKVSEPQLMAWLQTTRADIGGMFALDALMPNVDRHLGNILFHTVGPRLRALAFDWSRTHLFMPWPWPTGCASAQIWQWLRQVGHASQAAVDQRMQRLSDIDAEQVRAILMAAPEEWRDTLDIDAAAQWWKDNIEHRALGAKEILQAS